MAAIGVDLLESIENAGGSDFADELSGSSKANVLEGQGGDDKLNGLSGVDTCTGGLGADHFVVGKATDTGLLQAADLITDFSTAEGGKIDLSLIDARKSFGNNDVFVFADQAPNRSGADSCGVLWFADGYLLASTDKDTAAEFSLRVIFKDAGPNILGAADILL